MTPPVKLMRLLPAVAVTAPPQTPVTLGGVATAKPAGRLSEKETAVRYPAGAPFGPTTFGTIWLVIVKTSATAVPGLVELGTNAAEIDGA
jgi:hypothetical protein